MIIRIKNLRVRAVIGINEWERKNKQDVVINVEIEFDGQTASESDEIESTVNYKTVAKRIIKEVEESQFFLLEKLATHVLDIVMEDEKVRRANVEVDKPHALRFADSVSAFCSAERGK